MNFKIVIVLALSIFSFQFASAQAFVELKERAVDVTFSPKKGKFFIIGDNRKQILEYDKRRNKFKAYGPEFPTSMQQFVFDAGGDAYGLTEKNVMYRRVGEEWKSANLDGEGGGRGHVYNLGEGVNKKSKVWILRIPTGDVFRYSWRRNRRVLPVKSNKDFRKIAPLSNDLFYLIKKDNSIHMYKNGELTRLPGRASEIAVDRKMKDAYIIDNRRRIAKWDKKSKNWKVLRGTRTDFKKLSVFAKNIMAVSTDGKLYQYDRYAKPVQESATTTAPTPKPENEYAGTYRVEITWIFTNSGDQRNFGKSIDIYGTMGIYLNAKTGGVNVDVKPINKKKNRILDISKNDPIHVKGIPKKTIRNAIVGGKKCSSCFYAYGEHEIDKIREFKVPANLANGYLTFDLQANISHKLLVGKSSPGWKRQKINIKDVNLGKEEYMILYEKLGSTEFLVGYKITKQ